ncbi:MAG: ribose-5-phosphate isomerase RpiA [Thermoplasmata archaeon]
MPVDLDAEKKHAAHAAVERVRAGTRLALGTGSTASWMIRALAVKFPKGKGLTLVASSQATEQLANDLGLPVRPVAEGDRFDLMLDGADEVSPQLDLTKGWGGALLREKLLARLSKEMVIMVDHTKLVTFLGQRSPIPIEVVPFARPILAHEWESRGHRVTLRRVGDGTGIYRTDNGNEILDLRPVNPITDPRAFADDLKAMTGVVETGIFPGLATTVLVGHPDGRLEELSRSGRG